MLKEILQYDVDGKLKDKLYEMGWFISPKTGRWSQEKAVIGINPDNDFIFPNYDPSQKCKLYQTITLVCGLIPDYCLSCWKVVVHPKTLLETMTLLKWQDEYVKGYIGIDRYCKAGIETRKYVPYNYGAYFYCRSKKEGQERKKDVRKAVNTINKEIPVDLKRYCTEFELRLGPSDRYKKSVELIRLEEKIFRRIDISTCAEQPPQPEDIRKSILAEWIKFAWEREDPTAALFNDNEPLYTPSVTY